MSSSLNKKLVPVEEIIFDGLARRFQRVMGFPCVWKTADDEVQILKRTGAGLRYPYATLFHSATEIASNRENTQATSRRGASVLVSDDQRRQFKVMYLPANLTVDVTIFEDSAQRARTHLHRALFASRQGWFKFSVNYGAQNFDIGCVGPTSISFPRATSDQDADKRYILEFPLVMDGKISESVLMEEQIIDSVQVSTYVGGGTVENSDRAFPPTTFTHTSDSSKEPT